MLMVLVLNELLIYAVGLDAFSAKADSRLVKFELVKD